MEKIQETAIVLDTNSFGDINTYNFEKSKITICANSFKNIKNITVFIPSIVIEELKKHILQSIKLSKEKIKSIYLKKYIDDIVIENIYNAETRKLEEFISNKNIKVIDCNKYTNLAEVNKWYFAEEFPFEKAKPKEFPDAMIISATKNYLKSDYDKVYVVSTDNGFKEAIKRKTKYTVSDDIGKIMEELLGIKEYEIRNCDGYIQNNNLLSNIDLYKLTTTEDGEYEIDEINYNIMNIEIIDKAEGHYIVCVDTSLKLQGDFTLLDPTMSFYDREDPEYSILYYRTGKQINIENYSVFLALYFDNKKKIQRYENIEVEEINISDYFGQLDLVE